MHIPYVEYGAHAAEEQPTLILNNLWKHGCVVVSDFPALENDDEFLGFARSMGTPRRHSLRATTYALRVNPGKFVYSIEVKPNSMRNEQGQIILSNTSDEFPCHTDEYFLEIPASTVLLLCCSSDRSGGGLTLLAHIDDIVPFLTLRLKATLQAPMYPHPDGSVSILSEIDGRWRIRYNWGYIKGLIKKQNRILTPQMGNALERLEHAIRESRCQFLLRQKECLIFDNHRILHGRTAFDATGGRRLKRIRVHRCGGEPQAPVKDLHSGS